MGIHLGSPRVCVEVGDAEGGTSGLEVFGKLAPIVGLEFIDDEWTDVDKLLEEVGGTGRSVTRVCARKGELPFNIDSGQDVPLRPINEADDGVELHASFGSLGTAYFLAIRGIPLKGSPCARRE